MAYDNDTGRSASPVSPEVPIAPPVVYNAFGVSRYIGEGGKSFTDVTPFTPKLPGVSPIAFPLDYPPAPFYNTFQTYTGSCPALYSGTPVTRTANPGEFASRISVAVANANALASITAAANAALVCTAVPQISASYVSGTGSITYRGYIDPRYMRTNLEFGTRTASSVIPPYSAGNTYQNYRRCFYGAKFYRSLQNGNLANQPDISPAFWTECESPVYWLAEAMGGHIHQCYWANSATCTVDIYVQRTHDNDFLGNASVDHTTGAETWGGLIRRYPDTAINPGGSICPSRDTSSYIDDANQISTLNGMAQAGNGAIGSVTSSKITRTDTACNGATFATAFNDATRTFSTPEIAENYFTMSGAGTQTINGTWNDNGWTNNNATVSVLTANCSNLIVGRSYQVDIVYSVSGGPTPTAYSTTFVAAGTTNSFSVTTPFGAAAQTTSIASLTITLLP